MFDQLFVHPHAIRRHRESSLAQERSRYLAYLSQQGVAHGTLHINKQYLLVIRPLTCSAVWRAVAERLRPIAQGLRHYGPHALRHACATHLLNEGLSLKEVGDHLGHRDPEATRIYAKVDLARLRDIAKFDLGGLL